MDELFRSASGVQMKKSKATSALFGVTGNTCLAGELQVSSGQKAVSEMWYPLVSCFTQCRYCCLSLFLMDK